MKARLFDSLEQMLSPEGLATVIGTPVERRPGERRARRADHCHCNAVRRSVHPILEHRNDRRESLRRVRPLLVSDSGTREFAVQLHAQDS